MSLDKIRSSGVWSMFLSTASFFVANICIKKIGHLPAMEIVFFRCLIGSLACAYGIIKAGESLRGTNRTMLLLRGLFGTTALYLFFVTLQNIPLATAMTIQYLSPIFTGVIAIFVLSESVRAAQWLFYAIAFGGVLLIERTDARIETSFLVIGIISAFCSGVAYNLVRSMRGREYPLTIVFHFQLTGMIIGLAFTIFDWQMPQGTDWVYIILVGIFSQLGQIFLTAALQRERVASVAIINYSGLVYGIIVGWLWFGEPQPIYAYGGMVLVVIGVLMNLFYTRRVEIQRAEIESSVS